MIDGRIVRVDSTIKTHPYVIEARRDEAYNGQELCGDAGSTLGYAEPFLESVRGAKDGQGDKSKADEKICKTPTESRTSYLSYVFPCSKRSKPIHKVANALSS